MAWESPSEQFRRVCSSTSDILRHTMPSTPDCVGLPDNWLALFDQRDTRNHFFRHGSFFSSSFRIVSPTPSTTKNGTNQKCNRNNCAFSSGVPCFSIAVVQSPFTAFPCFLIQKSNLLKARVIIYAYNEHVWLLPPEPWSQCNHSLLGSREPTLL
jgi:hypothetical protein